MPQRGYRSWCHRQLPVAPTPWISKSRQRNSHLVQFIWTDCWSLRKATCHTWSVCYLPVLFRKEYTKAIFTQGARPIGYSFPSVIPIARRLEGSIHIYRKVARIKQAGSIFRLRGTRRPSIQNLTLSTELNFDLYRRA